MELCLVPIAAREIVGLTMKGQRAERVYCSSRR
jgi:hypothetical protein